MMPKRMAVLLCVCVCVCVSSMEEGGERERARGECEHKSATTCHWREELRFFGGRKKSEERTTVRAMVDTPRNLAAGGERERERMEREARRKAREKITKIPIR